MRLNVMLFNLSPDRINSFDTTGYLKGSKSGMEAGSTMSLLPDNFKVKRSYLPTVLWMGDFMT